MSERPVSVLITGGTGRIGRVLRQTWPRTGADNLRPIWQARRDVPGSLTWDILNEGCPEGVAGGVVLALAGGVNGTGLDMGLNVALGLAACHAAAAQGARHVFLASSAAVYGVSEPDFDEESVCAPINAYGIAKLRMEREARAWNSAVGADAPVLTVLRIGNIAGLDALLGGARPGVPVVLDPVNGGQAGPVRSYIGPVTLASVLVRLAGMAAAGTALPEVLNIAASPPVGMDGLLRAAGIAWHFGPANPAVKARVALDTTRLQELIPLPQTAGQPKAMVAEWHAVRNAVA